MISAAQAESLYKQISARRWTKVEPVDVPTEAAQWFRRSLTLSAGTGDVAQACRLASVRVGGNVGDLTGFVDWSDSSADVVPLTGRRRTTKSRG